MPTENTAECSNCSPAAATFICRPIVLLYSPLIRCCGEAMVFANFINGSMADANLPKLKKKKKNLF